ncbi:hypothetical protein [Alteraurantiacibacter aestuarii]|uniref:hypothetical protein n=1 Tax=Alteraurantiacibacter aestuarii TaxID=650004 RepID=UPI0031DFB712
MTVFFVALASLAVGKALDCLDGELITRRGAPVPPFLLGGLGISFFVLPVWSGIRLYNFESEVPVTLRDWLLAGAFLLSLGVSGGAIVVMAWAQAENLGMF